jgi:hypothetical protein
LLGLFCLSNRVTGVTTVGRFGSASALLKGYKEAATSKSNMTFTLFDLRHFLKSRSGWRNGVMHSLS